MFFSAAGSGVLMYTQILTFLLIELAVEDASLVSMTVLTDLHSTSWWYQFMSALQYCMLVRTYTSSLQFLPRIFI